MDVKGQCNDITGMEHILETMKAEGIKPDTHAQYILARNYVFGGLKEKAEAVPSSTENGDNSKQESGPSIQPMPILIIIK